jgi:putative ABC transport system substrate-binding protein
MVPRPTLEDIRGDRPRRAVSSFDPDRSARLATIGPRHPGLLRSIVLAMLVTSLLPASVATVYAAGKVYRIGHVTSVDFDQPEQIELKHWGAFVQALGNLGWVEGKNFVFERRKASSQNSVLQQAAEDLVRLKVDVILVSGGARAAAIQQVTRTVPIVTLSAGDLVGSGIVPSLTRPGGNITGMLSYAPEIMGKRLQMLRELNPALARVAVLRRYAWHAGILAAYQTATDAAAQKLGLKLHYLHFNNADELATVFAEARKERDGAVLIWDDPAISEVAPQILDLAMKNRLPTIADAGRRATLGALIGYGPNPEDLYRQAATHVDRILKGAKPGDLPIGQPTVFELVCNLKTARALNVAVPKSILLLADRVIE